MSIHCLLSPVRFFSTELTLMPSSSYFFFMFKLRLREKTLQFEIETEIFHYNAYVVNSKICGWISSREVIGSPPITVSIILL